jgi:hypothetical protein
MAEYLNSPVLQHVFIDKDTATPLVAGKVYFYEDNDRSTLKDIYVNSGTPGNPDYVVTDNPQVLDSSGSFSDMVYLYPYDENGSIQQYFVEIYSATAGGPPATPQRTIESFPAISKSSTQESLDVRNYIDNGQFLIHQVEPKTDTKKEGEIRSGITNIALGEWTFERPDASTATDIVTFKSFSSWSDTPNGNPKFRLNVVNEGSGANPGTKDIRVKFKNVNFFASDDKKLTIVFVARSNSAGSFPVDFRYYKFFGTGGSSSEEGSINSFTIGTSYKTFSYTFSLGDNTGKDIGPSKDDYIQFVWRLPSNSTFDLDITDVMLLPGEFDSPLFEEERPEETISRTVGGSLPVPSNDGSTLYLPLVQTKKGFVFDDSEIGQIKAFSTEGDVASYKNCDGAKYETSATDPTDGVPYSRLQSKIGYTFGTGRDYFQASDPGTTATLNIGNNSHGAVTTTTDGTTATGFTFVEVHKGDNYYTDSVLGATNGHQILILNKNPGVVSAAAAGTSGFTVKVIQTGSSELFQITEITTNAATSLKGKYFTFESYDTSVKKYAVWYADETGGTAPTVSGHTLIKITVDSSDTKQIVAIKTMMALKGAQVTNIVTVDGSSAVQSSFFNIYSTDGTTSYDYYVWINKDGGGTDPNITNSTGIEVKVSSSDTDDQVAKKLHDAVNNKYFQVPDLRGIFLRGWDNGSGVDKASNNRWSHSIAVKGDHVGTFQFSANIEHKHELQRKTGSEGGSGSFQDVNNPDTQDYTKNSGSYESRPINMYVNYKIKY